MADALPSATTSSVRDRRDEFTRRAILVEARAILAQQGLDALSLRTLAEAVGYSPAALYRYFSNKEALLDAIRLEGWALLGGFEPDASADAPPAERLAAYMGRIGRFAAAHPEHYRLMVGSPDAPPLSPEAWRADPPTADLIAALTQAAAAGTFELRGRTPEQVVLQAWLLAHGAALLRQTVLRDEAAWAGLLADGALGHGPG